MAYVSLYRKYRSQSFDDLIGQDHVVRTLQNAITSERIAHAYLFTGPRGTGKTSTARLLAKALCCEDGPKANPPEDSEICRSIAAGTCIDVIEMDAASESSVDDIRDKIVEVAEYQPMICRYKVFIIDEVHDLSAKAFDALLKTIEEPPPHVIFILATTEFNKVPPTVRSRCQKFEFHRASMSDLTSRLSYVLQQEGVEAEPAAVSAIARMADGGYRDALTLVEQAILTSEGTIRLEQVYDQLGLVSEELVDQIFGAMKDGDLSRIIALLDDVARLGRDPRALLESMMHRLSDLTRAAYTQGDGKDAAAHATLHAVAVSMGQPFIVYLRGAIAEAHRHIRDISLPRLWLESELIRVSVQRNATPAPVASAAVGAKPAVAAAKPTPVQQVASEPTPVAEKSGAFSVLPTDNAPESVWARAVASLSAGGKVSPMGMKLEGSKLLKFVGGVLDISLPRQMDIGWFNEKPVRLGHIQKLVQDAGGSDWTIRFSLDASQSPRADTGSAVELPLEGPRLEQLVREVFGDNASSPPESTQE